MIDEKLMVPLSPPTSPRMSGAGAKINEYQWQHPDTTTLGTVAPALSQQRDAQLPGVLQKPPQTPIEQIRPPLRSHKSFPYSLGPSSRLQNEVGQEQPSASLLGDFQERVLSQGPQPTGSSDLQQPTFGGSAPASPAGRLTPNSPAADEDDETMDDEMIDFSTADQDDEVGKRPLTAAELRANKRKMKRFRLTHNQTRFLMSEFARQAHPDAAHRERLSREIPGLSPRQVQVWFQNRRAKLKRLTTDDRERMMRSRALPADFDMTQALHAPFGAPPPNMGTPAPSPGIYGSFSDAGAVRPLTLDTLRRVPDYEGYGPQFTSPTGISPAIGAFAFTPPQSATDTMSPASAGSSFNFQTQESPRRHPFGGPLGAQSSYHQPQLSRLHFHERFTRPTGEVAGSPLRTSMSYSGLASSSSTQSRTQERAQSFSEQSYTHERQQQQSRSTTASTTVASSGPYGLGFSYPQMSSYQPGEQQQQQQQQQQASTSMNSQPTVDFHQYRRGSSHLAGPPISYAHYPSQNFTTPQVPQYSLFSGHFAPAAFHSPYQPQAADQQQHQEPAQQRVTENFTPVPSHSQQFTPLGATTDQHAVEESQGDNSDGGVPVPAQY